MADQLPQPEIGDRSEWAEYINNAARLPLL
jgi:hypothetical protein